MDGPLLKAKRAEEQGEEEAEVVEAVVVKWHWVRSMVTSGEVELHYVKTTAQPADMMTKRLVEQQHWKCCKLAGMALN
ncbi:hypothetical protein CLOP_g826 [Closterium sp. NIES-67]|nr:hypothetical protein CLOP_g826 [Closterium sp. NIES-67]